MKHTLSIAAAVLFLAVPTIATAAGDPAAGKTKAASCAGCHGANGEGKGSYPALAGHSEADTVKALQDYKSGARPSPVMKPLSTPLSDADMANLGAYYASLKK
ncbi:MAG TPA: cytochrome c [Casimicrobiaceae bacterium]|nr:cytochrome c [Casimicrobiaceae bacterium]